MLAEPLHCISSFVVLFSGPSSMMGRLSMTRKRQSNESLHEQAVSIMEKHLRESIGATLEADAKCNECGDALSIDLVKDASSVERNKNVGPVRPDLSVFDSDNRPVRFIEIVDSHKPESNVHEYALGNKIDVFEFHLNAEREFVGRRRNKALDASLNVKVRLTDLREKRLKVDAHTLLCQRPKCEECSSPLPQRTIAINLKDCWNCKQNVKVAVGYKDHCDLEQDFFTDEELEFVKENGVILERRFSGTLKAKYRANVCPQCDQIQGNWYLYQDPLHDRFNLPQTRREAYGPCDKCAARFCRSHGEYFDYTGNMQCPECVRESEKTMCPNVPDRECFYPDRCQESGCYFQNRQSRPFQQESPSTKDHTEQLSLPLEPPSGRPEKREMSEDWREFNNWVFERRSDTNDNDRSAPGPKS